MADPRAYTTYQEQNAQHLTFKKDGTITYTASNYDGTFHSPQIGFAVSVVGDSQVGLGASGAYLEGALVRVENDGFVTVQVAGTFGFIYNPAGGNPPLIGRGVKVDGTGKVITVPNGGVRETAERGTVLSLDAVGGFAFVRF